MKPFLLLSHLAHLAIPVALLAGFPLSLAAQDFTIEEERESGGFIDYWNRHFSFRLGGSYSHAVNGAGYRAYGFSNLTWQHDFDWIAFSFDGDLYHRDYKYILVQNDDRRDELQRELNDLNSLNSTGDQDQDRQRRAEIAEIEEELSDIEAADEEVELTLIENRGLLREANVKLRLGDYVELSGGMHTIVWGQLDLVSPVDIYLPLRFDGGELSFSKVNNRLPQLSAILSIFPISQVELQGYYFPVVTLDSSNRQFFERPREGRNEDIYEIENEFLYPQDDPDQDAAQYAGRLLLYFNWATIGFTYFRTWEQFIEDKNRRLISEENDMNDNGINDNGVNDTEENGRSSAAYFIEDTPRLQSIDVYGFEMAIPTGRLTWKLDASYREVEDSIDIFNLGLFNRVNMAMDDGMDAAIFSGEEAEFRAQEALIDWAKQENNGSLDIAIAQTIVGVGVDADLDRWLFNLGLIYLDDQPKGANDQQGLDLEEDLEAVQSNEEEEITISTVPFINIGRYLSEDKKDIIGFAAGFFGFGFGATLYFGQEYFEALQFGLALEYLSLFSSNETEDAIDGYELRDSAYPGVRVLLAYKF